MTARRPALAAVLVVTAVAVPSVAWASWGTTSPGTAAALAGTLTAPSPSFGTTTCTGKGPGNVNVTVPLSWSTPGATSYDLQWDTAQPFTQPATNLTGTNKSISFSINTNKTTTLYVHLRAHAGNWLTAYGEIKSETVSCP